MEKVDAVSTIKKRSLPILKRHDVKRAAIFGSFARGKAKARSDVDFLIEYQVDIITYNSIYWRIKEQILAEQVVIL